MTANEEQKIPENIFEQKKKENQPPHCDTLQFLRGSSTTLGPANPTLFALLMIVVFEHLIERCLHKRQHT